MILCVAFISNICTCLEDIHGNVVATLLKTSESKNSTDTVSQTGHVTGDARAATYGKLFKDKIVQQ